MELAGVVEAEDVVGLLGEVVFGFGEESEGGVAVDDGLQVGEAAGLVGNELASGAVVLVLALLSEIFGGFGDEEGGGELEEVGFRVRIRV